jgi:hypothetical protein
MGRSQAETLTSGTHNATEFLQRKIDCQSAPKTFHLSASKTFQSRDLFGRRVVAVSQSGANAGAELIAYALP